MYDKFFARSGDREFPEDLPGVKSGARRPILYMDQANIPETTFMFECSWLTKPFDEGALTANDNDAMVFMCGPDRNDPENLRGKVRFTIENDAIDITETCSVYIPAGCAHKLEVLDVDYPIMYCYCEFAPTATRKPAQATAAAGTYDKHVVYRYEPSSGIIPQAPEGFLQLLVWMAGDKVEGAPYLELCRFMTVNPTGPEKHTHNNVEFIGFLGTDPDNPGELNADVVFCIGDEEVHTTKSTVIFVPSDLPHSPILVPALDREIIHFSGSPASEYVRISAEN